jgi:sugar phosphate isomerase/epimerase
MPLPIALQLYTLRDALAKDFTGVMTQVAEMGYIGVEGANAAYASTTVEAAAKLFKDLGLTVPSAHIGLPLGDKKNEVLDTMKLFDCKRLVLAHIPPEKFQTVDQIKTEGERMNEADVVCRENGLTLLYHNHWWEYEQLDGRWRYQIMLDYLAPTIQLELDTYWIKTGGPEPVDVIKEMGKRAPLLHIKDGPCTVKDDMTAVGEGTLNWHEIIGASDGAAEWLIVEIDRCATDMLEAVRKSYRYLIQEGFARGNKS